jgi:hypothetical protein
VTGFELVEARQSILKPAAELTRLNFMVLCIYAARRLLGLDFTGKQTRELLGDRDLSMTEVTAVIARGIGAPNLSYKQVSYDQMQQALTQAGFSPKKAAVYVEMFTAINTGVLAPLEPRSAENTTPTSFEKFVQDVFAPAYSGAAATSA